MRFTELVHFLSSNCRTGQKLLFIFSLLVFPPLLLKASAETAAVPTMEYQLKASLVYNVLHFVTWPEGVLKEDSITICQIGPDLYGKAFLVLEGKMVQGRPIALKRHNDWRDILAKDCQVVVSSELSETASLQSAALNGVLTIGDSPRFLENGGIIKFLVVDNSIKFDVNLERAKHGRLVIGTKLLRLANNVRTKS